MHERSLVRALLRQVDAIRRQHAADHVTEVRVEIGPMSGVEPALLSTAFDQIATSSAVANAKLLIDEVKLLAECKTCDRQFEIINFVFRCPVCDGSVRVTQGDQFQLVSVSLQTGEPIREPVS